MELIVIPMMVFAIPLLAIWTHHVRKVKKMNAERDPVIEKELEKLRSRIEVLERIVTDGKYDLDRRIRDLD
jgi:SMC interacting uncharacterized protein involved in chromosome segregation